MIGQAKSWLQERSQREQWLLGGAGGFLFVAVAVYMFILPGYAAIQASDKQLQEATERRGRLVALAAIAKSAPKSVINYSTTVSDAPLRSIVTESAVAQGFEIADGVAAETNEYSFRLASAKAGPLLVWITSLETQGIELAEVKIRRSEGDFVAADIRLRRRQ